MYMGITNFGITDHFFEVDIEVLEFGSWGALGKNLWRSGDIYDKKHIELIKNSTKFLRQKEEE